MTRRLLHTSNPAPLRCRAALFGRSADAASSPTFAIESWVEWEEAALRPAAYSGDSAALAAAVARLATGLAGRKHLVGGQLSLADCVVYGTLRPLLGSSQVRWGSELGVQSAEPRVLQRHRREGCV